MKEESETTEQEASHPEYVEVCDLRHLDMVQI